MDNVVCDIAKNRMEKDFNEALKNLGLYCKSIRFENNENLSISIELSSDEKIILCT